MDHEYVLLNILYMNFHKLKTYKLEGVTVQHLSLSLD